MIRFIAEAVNSYFRMEMVDGIGGTYTLKITEQSDQPVQPVQPFSRVYRRLYEYKFSGLKNLG